MAFGKRVKRARRSLRKAYQAPAKALGLRQKAAEYDMPGQPSYSEAARSRSAGAGVVDFVEGSWS